MPCKGFKVQYLFFGVQSTISLIHIGQSKPFFIYKELFNGA